MRPNMWGKSSHRTFVGEGSIRELRLQVLTAVGVEHLPTGLWWVAPRGAGRIRPGTLAVRWCPPRSDAALFIFCGIEPRIQRERAQHLAQVAVAAAVERLSPPSPSCLSTSFGGADRARCPQSPGTAAHRTACNFDSPNVGYRDEGNFFGS